MADAPSTYSASNLEVPLQEICEKICQKYSTGRFQILFPKHFWPTISQISHQLSTCKVTSRLKALYRVGNTHFPAKSSSFILPSFCEVHQFQIANLFTLLPSHKKTAAAAYSGYIMA